MPRDIPIPWPLTFFHLYNSFLIIFVDIARTNWSVLTLDIFDILRDLSIDIGGEIQFADSINLQVENNMIMLNFVLENVSIVEVFKVMLKLLRM